MEFRIIPGHTEYAINEDGTIVKRIKSENPKWLKPAITQYFIKDKGKDWPMGYYYVTLITKDAIAPQGHHYYKSCHRTISVHRLVAMTWLGAQPEGKPWVNHEDESKINNHYSNLKWESIAYNIKHANAMGLIKRPRGADHYLFGKKIKASTKRKMSDAKRGAKSPNHIGMWHTPHGIFGSCSEAANAIGCARQNVWAKCRDNDPGWALVRKEIDWSKNFHQGYIPKSIFHLMPDQYKGIYHTIE